MWSVKHALQYPPDNKPCPFSHSLAYLTQSLSFQKLDASWRHPTNVFVGVSADGFYLLLRGSRLSWDCRPELESKEKDVKIHFFFRSNPVSSYRRKNWRMCKCAHSGWLVGGRRQRWERILYHTRGDDLCRWQRCHVLQGFVFGRLILQIEEEEWQESTTRWQHSLNITSCCIREHCHIKTSTLHCVFQL